MKSNELSFTKQKWTRNICILIAAIATVSTITMKNVSAESISVMENGVLASSNINLPALTTIDTPDNESVSNSIVISGWALNKSGISRVDMYAFSNDGTPHWLGSVSSKDMTGRPDVLRVFNQYNNLNSGYSFSADISNLKSGNYTLSVAGIGNDGNVQWATKNFTVGPFPATCIDFPSVSNPNENGDFSITGWALNKSGVSRIDMYAYDSAGAPHWLGSVPAKNMTARPDVKNAFPLFNSMNNGYNLTVDSKALPAGGYTLAIANIGNDGDVNWATRKINVGPYPMTCIDSPNNNASTSNGTLNIAGWALNKSGISRVDMYVFDAAGTPHWLGSVPSVSLFARQDVKNTFPAFNTLNSGYNYTANVSAFSAGTYTLAIAGIGNDGEVQWATKQFVIPGNSNDFHKDPAQAAATLSNELGLPIVGDDGIEYNSSTYGNLFGLSCDANPIQLVLNAWDYGVPDKVQTICNYYFGSSGGAAYSAISDFCNSQNRKYSSVIGGRTLTMTQNADYSQVIVYWSN